MMTTKKKGKVQDKANVPGKKKYVKPAIKEEHVLQFSSLGTTPPGGMPGC
jgi:hypothetical protein